MSAKGLTSKDIKVWHDLLVKSNNIQLKEMFKQLQKEVMKRKLMEDFDYNDLR